MSLARSLLAAALVASLAGCGGEAAQAPRPRVRPLAAIHAEVATAAPPVDPLGPKPEPADPPTFTPPSPVRYDRKGGLEVWLLERRGLPIVSMQLVVPAGSAHDPEGKAGLAAITAGMLDEGAGKRGPLELASDVDRLGATLQTGAVHDYAYVSLTSLKKNLAPAVDLFADVVARPQLAPAEWKRVHDLWQNAVKARQSDPSAVADVVVWAKVFPTGHPYATPRDGTVASSAKLTLADVKAFYKARWRPDRAKLVVVGDVTRAELDPLLDKALGAWKAPASPPPAEPPAASMAVASAGSRRVFVVDRPDAPQSVIAVARPGVAASEQDGAVLGRLNTALGGSFTSRLNQDLREEHGWSYGAHSRFSWNRATGLFVAQAAVQTAHTGDALKAMLADIEGMQKGGLTAVEVDSTRKQARGSVVEAFETVQATAARLARNAGVGLPPEHEAASAKAAQQADAARLNALAAKHLDVAGATVVIVGPRAKIEPQLQAIGIQSVEPTGPEGR